jgi:hypothetical protein
LKKVLSAQKNNCDFRVKVAWKGWGGGGWVEKIVGYKEIHNFVAFTK